MVKTSLKARGHFLGAGVKQFINNKGAVMEQQQCCSTWENAIMRIALRSANCPGNLLKGNIQMHFNIFKILLQQI